MAEMLGYTMDEMIGQNFFAFMSESWVEIAREKLAARQQGRSEQHVFEFLRKEGSPISTLVDARPLFNADNQVEGAVANVIDISAQKKVEEEIKSLAKFPEENPNPVLRVSSDNTILYANQASQPLLEAWGCNISGIMPDWLPMNHREKGTGAVSFNVEVQVNDHTYEFEIVPIKGMNYRNLYGKDITKGKYAEEDLKQSEEKYRLLFNSMNDAVGVSILYPDWSFGSIIEVNDTLCELSGYTREELFQLTPMDLVDPSEIENMLNLKETLVQDREYLAERTYIAKDGAKIPVEVHTRVFTYKGQLAMLYSCAEHREAEGNRGFTPEVC